jgi:hypothetical protein
MSAKLWSFIQVDVSYKCLFGPWRFVPAVPYHAQSLDGELLRTFALTLLNAQAKSTHTSLVWNDQLNELYLVVFWKMMYVNAATKKKSE